MKRNRWKQSKILAVVILAVAFSNIVILAESESIGILVKGNNAFALNMYRKIAVSEGNLLFSPYSLSSAMAMTYAGAKENTAKEMKDTLRFHLGQENSLRRTWNWNGGPSQCNIASTCA